MLSTNAADQTKWLYLFLGLAVLANFSGLFVTITGPDAALYASIAKTMVQRNNYAELFVHGKDWLDKPHFPFWVTALFFKAFGFTTWAYKLPGILFLLMGAVYTYLFSKSLYNKQIALWSVLILLTAQHIVLSNTDVRAEPYLTGLIIASVYHFYIAYAKNRFWHLLIACIFTACSIMTKGMFALIPIGGAIAGHLVITRQWKQLFNLRWLIAAVLIFIFILPEIYCLYLQFDLHPEKVVFGHQNVSGIRFFFWDSQFGRFFNTGPIKGHGDPFFFVHTTLWAFLPWSLLLFAAIFQYLKKYSKDARRHEWYCLCGSLLTFLLFSASKFQLPHYLNIVFPFFAITTAQYLVNLKSVKSLRVISIVQTILIILLLVAIAVLHYYFRPDTFCLLTAILLGVLVLLLVFLPASITKAHYRQIGFRTLLAAFIVNLYLNLAFYPSLLHYQSGSEAAIWINQHNPQKTPVVQTYDDNMYPMEFYLNQPLIVINEDGLGKLPPKPFLFYAPATVIKTLSNKGWNIQPVANFERYWITRLKLAFLNKATRGGEVVPVQLVIVH